MSIIPLVLVLLVVGFLIYVVQTAPIPISPWFRTIINGVIAFAALIFVLNTLGVHTGIHLRF